MELSVARAEVTAAQRKILHHERRAKICHHESLSASPVFDKAKIRCVLPGNAIVPGYFSGYYYGDWTIWSSMFVLLMLSLVWYAGTVVKATAKVTRDLIVNGVSDLNTQLTEIDAMVVTFEAATAARLRMLSATVSELSATVSELHEDLENQPAPRHLCGAPHPNSSPTGAVSADEKRERKRETMREKEKE